MARFSNTCIGMDGASDESVSPPTIGLEKDRTVR